MFKVLLKFGFTWKSLPRSADGTTSTYLMATRFSLRWRLSSLEWLGEQCRPDCVNISRPLCLWSFAYEVCIGEKNNIFTQKWRPLQHPESTRSCWRKRQPLSPLLQRRSLQYDWFQLDFQVSRPEISKWFVVICKRTKVSISINFPKFLFSSTCLASIRVQVTVTSWLALVTALVRMVVGARSGH